MISKEEENMIEAVGWTLTCHSPMEMEHEDGSTVTGVNTCRIIIEDAIKEYKEMKEDEAREAEESKKAEATSSLNLEDINGMEILEFLNDQIDNNDDLCDVSLDTPLEFEEQGVSKNTDGELMYSLNFTAYYNNWGTDQPIQGNKIKITNKSIYVLVGEAFEGDGSDEEIENLLREWLKTHKFQSRDNVKGEFESAIKHNIMRLELVKLNDTELMDEVIENLNKARALMK